MSKIKLSDRFTVGRLFRFVLPSVAMMVFISIYGVVDGFFVSNFAGKTSFASINLIMPFVMIQHSVLSLPKTLRYSSAQLPKCWATVCFTAE